MLRVIAVIAILTGVWMMIMLKSTYTNIAHALDLVAQNSDAWVMILLVAHLITPIFKVIAGIGLFMKMRWSWISIHAVLLLDIIGLGISIVRFHRYSTGQSLDSSVYTQGAVIVETNSIVPTYVVGLLSILLQLLILSPIMRRSWKNIFEPA